MKKALVLLKLMLVIAASGFSQATWVQTTTPPGGSVWALASIGNNLFAGTNTGVYFSADNGITWAPRNGNVLGMEVKAMIAHGPDIFVGARYGPAGDKGIFKSSDMGISWTNITPPNLFHGEACTFVISNNHIYVGISMGDRGVLRSPLTGISTSSWTTFNTGLPSIGSILTADIRSLAVMGTSIVAGTYGNGIFVSPAATANWTSMGNGLVSNADYIQSLAIKGQYLFAGNISGLPSLYRSTNSGVTWIPSSTFIFENKPVYSLLVNNNRLYAGVEYIGVFVSDDNGLSWSTYREGMTNPSNPWGWNCNHMNIRSMIIVGNTLFAGTDCGVWKRTINDQYNTIFAKAFYDANLNSIKDTGEPFYPLANLTVTKGTDTSYVSSSTGHYSITVDTGTYKSILTSYSPYHVITPAIHTSSFNSYFNTDSVLFAVQPMPGKRDMGIKLLSTGTARPGFPVTYRLVYGNKGTDTAGITIQLLKSNHLNFTAASLSPSYSVADTLRWNIASFKPGDGGYIDVHFQVQPPPVVNFNDTLISVASISSNQTDLTPADNISTLRQRVMGSYDPNDKRENHGGRISYSAITSGEKLQYTIRFQNTGNDTAFTVIIKDTLSTKLNWNSLQMVSSSHDYQMNLSNGICTWTFNDIKLVDSNQNEALSHGFITFEISGKPNVVTGDVISNRAGIYFDYNLPVLTNMETTAIISEVLPVKLLSFIAIKQDNGNLLKWETGLQTGFSHFEIERSENGQSFATIGNVNAGGTIFSFTDDRFRKTLNYYRLRMVDVDGKSEYSQVQKINNQSGIIANIYPNPVKDVLQLSIENLHSKAVRLQVVTPEGRVVLVKDISLPAGLNTITVNTGSFASGIYLLRIITADSASQTLKFEKR